MKPTIVHFESCSDDSFLQYCSINKIEKEGQRRQKALLNLFGYVMRYELNEKQRECVYLAKIKGLKIKEIASMYRVASSTVCRRLKSAQKKLDKAFDHFTCISKFVDWSDYNDT